MELKDIQLTKGDIIKELGNRNFVHFAGFIEKDLVFKEFHKTYYRILDLWAKGIIKNLIITVPSQTGKSQGSTRMLPCYCLGKNPNDKIAVVSYAEDFASGFNLANQRYIDGAPYRLIFPETRLIGEGITGKYKRTSSEFEIVNHKGGLKTIGRKGRLTGDPVDKGIIDDVFKNAIEANSPVTRNEIIDFYKNVFIKRLHNDSQQLITFTRWHEDDLIGYLLENQDYIIPETWKDLENVGDKWVYVNFPAIKEDKPTEIDPREPGQVLWPEKHSREKYEKNRLLDEYTFQCMDQGNPTSKEGYLYDMKTYQILPIATRRKGNYTDTADMGDDYLCSICYDVGLDNLIYVTDVLYTQKPMEETEPLTAKMLEKNETKEPLIESNNGGRGFARAVQKLVPTIKIRWFHQGKNKESRILTNASTVCQNILMPEDWKTRWPVFYQHVKGYKRVFNANKYDDAADTLTGIAEREISKKRHKGIRRKN